MKSCVEVGGREGEVETGGVWDVGKQWRRRPVWLRGYNIYAFTLSLWHGMVLSELGVAVQPRRASPASLLACFLVTVWFRASHTWLGEDPALTKISYEPVYRQSNRTLLRWLFRWFFEFSCSVRKHTFGNYTVTMIMAVFHCIARPRLTRFAAIIVCCVCSARIIIPLIGVGLWPEFDIWWHVESVGLAWCGASDTASEWMYVLDKVLNYALLFPHPSSYSWG